MSYKIMSIISAACDFTTKSGGIWNFLSSPAIELRTDVQGQAWLGFEYRGFKARSQRTVSYRMV
jgi:hypothetical protein